VITIRWTNLVAIAAAGVLALGACSDPYVENPTASPKDIDCAAGKLSAEGSSAQNNAMTEWIKDYQIACPDATINYNPTGSGAGVQQFLAGQVDFAGSDSALDPDDDALSHRSKLRADVLQVLLKALFVVTHVPSLHRRCIDAASTPRDELRSRVPVSSGTCPRAGPAHSPSPR
jgi:ABC-type phosphate transport system substrate-binding protein